MRITSQRGSDIPKEFIGIFIEDINYAIDGGLYAEMLENRNFESLDVYGGKDCDYYAKYDGLYAWGSSTPNLQMEIVQGSPVSERSPHYLRLTCGQGGGSFWNQAYSGVHMRPGVACRVSFYARCVQYQGSVTVAVEQAGAPVLSETVEMRPACADGWKRWERYELTLCSETEIIGGRFKLVLDQEGVLEFDFFSMMPEDAVLGVFRRDLAQALKELHPGFLRFPGGCVVEGNTLHNRYRFQDTLGALEQRRCNWNRWSVHENSDANNWHGQYSHYGQTNGIGFYEYFLLCEYLGAKPLPVLGVGLACQYQSHERIEPEDERIEAYVREYLELIEFANGGPETRWGGVRCQMGHPKPFGLEMVGVGNEQWETPESRFFERYSLFERGIHQVYPDIKLIGTAGPELDSPQFEAAWKFYHSKESEKNFVYAVDEHYYTTPEWFLRHCDYFDRASRKTKVFFGEYAAHPACRKKSPEHNTLEAALAEAAFLTGMARNSDAVIMTCYAPLLARVGYTQWSPNLIWFDEESVCRTPSYYVQRLYAENLGSYNIGLVDAPVPCQASYDEKLGELVLMMVNPSSEILSIPLQFDKDWHLTGDEITEILLTGEALNCANTPKAETVRPVRRKLPPSESYQMVPRSFAVLRIPAVKSGGESAS